MKATTTAPPREITDRHAEPRMTAPTGRHVERGDEITVDGIRGRCVFLQLVTHTNGNQWVDVIHARTGRSRTVRPEAIRTAHRTHRTGVHKP